MREQFDPYYHWFGIRPNDQPPNHYRLLGIELFEDGLVVIDEAFHRRRDYLLKYVDGPHGGEARRILDELSAARNCLTRPTSKLAYDADLLLGPEQESDGIALAGNRGRSPIPPPTLREAGEPAVSNEPPHHNLPIPPPVTEEQPVAVDASGQSARRKSTRPPPVKKQATPSSRDRIKVRRLPVMVVLLTLAGFLAAAAFVWQTRDRNRNLHPETATKAASEKLSPTESATEKPAQSSTSAESSFEASRFKDIEAVDRVSISETLDEVDDKVAQESAMGVGPAEDAGAKSGEAPRVRKTGGGLPVRDGLAMWLDASNFESLQLDEDARVEQWNDSSGNNNHAAAPAVEESPVYVESSAGNFGRVRFDGKQSLVVTNGADLNFGDSYSFVFVAQGDEGVLADKGDGYKSGAFSFWNGVATFRTHNKMLKAGDPSPTSLKVRAVIGDNTAVRWFVGPDLTGVHEREHTIDNDQPFVIGARSKSSDPRFFIGELAELLVFDRALSDEEYGRLEEHLSAKWLSAPAPRIVAKKPSTAIDVDSAAAAPPTSDQARRAPDSAASFIPPSFTGEITREIWRECSGNTVEDVMNVLKERPAPDQTVRIGSFETPEDFADNYAQRLRGYLHPPETGQYEFKIRANAEGAIFLSSDTDPDNKQRIEPARPVNLTAGKVYYVEALHKESTGRDYFQVGWKLPSGTEEFPIPGSRISVKPRLIPPHETGFVLLTPIQATASESAKLELLEDGLVLATGPVNEGEIFDVVFEPDIPAITALRLEPQQHERLPANGPGFGPAGRFMLAEVTVSLKPNSDERDETSVAIGRVISEDSGARRLIDGDRKTKWLVRRGTRHASATLVFREPIELKQQSLLAIRLHNGEGIGCFRLLATSSPNPDRVPTSDTGPSDANSKDDLVLFVNVGGKTFSDQEGKTWAASRTFDGKTYGHEGGTSVTDDDAENPLAGSAQRGILGFRAAVPNGAYEVGLYFCEYWTDDSSRRVFSVSVERKMMLRNFDLLRAAGGQGRPFIFPIRKVIVKDERLDVDFQPAGPGASAILNAISIRRLR